MGKILRVNLSRRESKVEKLDEETAYNYLGGRGYATNLLYRELEPNTEAFSAENKLVFMTGPLTGTTFPGAGLVSISSKSPLTGTIFDCSMGGSFGAFLKFAGFDGIVVEGKSKEPVYLLVDDGKLEFKDASELWGVKTSEVEEYLRDKHENSRVIEIGPAGENCVNVAGVVSGTRTAGRGGLGGVMGSKSLKAIVVRGKNEVEIVHKDEYKKILRKIRQTIETDPLTGKDGSLSRFGTSLLVHRMTAADMLPRNNFSGENLDFEEVDSFSGETVREEFLVGQKGCFACPTECGRVVEVGKEEMKGPGYESSAMLGPNSGFYDYENEILPLSKLCDELGLDAISVGNILGFARGAGEISDFKGAKQLVKKIARGESVFSLGVVKAAEEKGEEEEAAHVKGMELPPYDPRGAKGIALAYATSSRGGCHLRAFTVAPEVLSNPEFVDPNTEVGKPELVRKMQDAYAVYDSLVACKYHGFALFTTLNYDLDDIAKLLSATTGLEWTNEILHEVGSRIYTLERLFNLREGISPEQDSLPEKFGIDLEDMLNSYYEEGGWSGEGVPKEEIPLRRPKRATEIELVKSPLERVDFPQVQVALDMDADIETICEIARRSYEGGVRIIEAGTPAIKRHGTDELIPPLREAAPEALIVADLKTMDVGDLEARMAFRAGADISAVLAIGGTNKITEALSEAVRRDGTILIDFIDCPEPLERLEELEEILRGYEDRVIFCLHRGISEQLKGRGIYEDEQLLSEAKERAGNFPLAVAGGIKRGVAKKVARAGAEVCVVGSAIYNSTDPRKTSERILEEIRQNYSD